MLKLKRTVYGTLIGIVILFDVCLVTVLFTFFPWIFTSCVYRLEAPRDTYDYLPYVIGFGSCFDQGKPCDVVKRVIDRHTEVFVFLGDNIYSDTTWMQIKRWDYNRLSCNTDFQNLVKSVPVVLATWDDHDYGYNDADGTYPMKAESRSLFLDFWRIPLDSPRRKHTAIYHVYRFKEKQKTLNIIVLDLRYFRSKENTCPNAVITYENYCPVNDSHIMEEEQWGFLESVLNENATVTVIASSTQLAHEYNRMESWTLFPMDLERFFDITKNRSNVYVISGDVHYGEISHQNNIWDVTASGMTHSSDIIEPNKFRVGEACSSTHYGELFVNWDTGVVKGSIVNNLGEVKNEQVLV